MDNKKKFLVYNLDLTLQGFCFEICHSWIRKRHSSAQNRKVSHILILTDKILPIKEGYTFYIHFLSGL